MKKDFKCVVYLFFASGMGALDKLRFDIVTHVNYAFAIPTPEGHVRPLENPELARAAIAKAHENGAKACISLGGWSYENVPLEATFKQATDTPEKIETLADEIVAMMEEFQFDGVDVDWEYPRPEDGSKEQYEAFIAALSRRLKPQGKLLTAAVFAGVDAKNQVPTISQAQDRPSFDLLDFMNLMTYDCDSPKHSTYEFAENCLHYWVEDRGFEPEKLTLGLPFYGRPAPGAFRLLLAEDKDALEKDCVSMPDGREVWYNGRETLRKKVALAKEYGLGGVMVWEIGEDCVDKEKSLLTVLGKAMQ